jgi:hypothetical protein
MNGNKFATGRILKNPVEVVKLVELKSLLNPVSVAQDMAPANQVWVGHPTC